MGESGAKEYTTFEGGLFGRTTEDEPGYGEYHLAPANPTVSGKVNGHPTSVNNRDALPPSFETDELTVTIS